MELTTSRFQWPAKCRPDSTAEYRIIELEIGKGIQADFSQGKMSKWPRPAGTKCGVNAYNGTARSSLDETWYWYDIGRQWSNARMLYVYIFHKKRKGVERKIGGLRRKIVVVEGRCTEPDRDVWR